MGVTPTFGTIYLPHFLPSYLVFQMSLQDTEASSQGMHSPSAPFSSPREPAPGLSASASVFTLPAHLAPQDHPPIHFLYSHWRQPQTLFNTSGSQQHFLFLHFPTGSLISDPLQKEISNEWLGEWCPLHVLTCVIIKIIIFCVADYWPFTDIVSHQPWGSGGNAPHSGYRAIGVSPLLQDF